VKAKLILILAVIMGLLTTFLFYQYMQKFEETDTASPSEWVEVVTTSQAIVENQRMTSEMLTMKRLPKEAVTVDHVKDVNQVVGKVAGASLSEGEAVLTHRLVDGEKESLIVARKIQEGYRAVSVGANLVQTVSNLIEPEDHVDVFVSEVKQESGEIESELVLGDIRVLAVGRRMLELDSLEAYVEYSSVTLEVDAIDAVKVVNANERGNIHLVLHSRIIPEDTEVMD